jgi:transposase
MAYGFRPYQLDQQHLLPVSPREWLPEGHLALFLADVVGQLDLGPVLRTYKGGRGPRGYHPQMLLTVLLYGYCAGVFSSRKLAARCETDVAFRVLSGGAFPDFRTLSGFRKRHLGAMGHLFVEVLRLCREAGLVTLGHVSLDGSKYQANASKHKAMCAARAHRHPARFTDIVASAAPVAGVP